MPQMTCLATTLGGRGICNFTLALCAERLNSNSAQTGVSLERGTVSILGICIVLNLRGILRRVEMDRPGVFIVYSSVFHFFGGDKTFEYLYGCGFFVRGNYSFIRTTERRCRNILKKKFRF